MKNLLIIIYVCFGLLSHGQKAMRWNYTLSAISTSTIYERVKIEDSRSFVILPRQFSLGTRFGAEYALSKRVSLSSMLEISANSINYYQWGVRNKSNGVFPKLGLFASYDLIQRRLTHQLSLGGMVLFNSSALFQTSYSGEEPYIPDRKSSTYYHQGIFPIIFGQYAVQWISPKYRKQAVFIYLTQGFKSIISVNLQTNSPTDLVNSFQFRGAYWGFGYTWYIRKQKPV